MQAQDFKPINIRDRRPASTHRADDPLPLYPELLPSEEYPVDALGPTLSKAAQAIANKIQVPPAIAAQSVLAVASLGAQAHADVLMPFGQERPLSLFLVTLAGSGDRKSSADAEALWPIRKREKALKEEYDLAIKDWSIEAAAWQAQRKKIEADKKLNYSGQMDELRALGDEPPRPLFPFITAPDPTIEGLIKAWVNAPAALGIFTAEGGQFTGGHGMNQDNRLKSAAGFSEIWDGKTIKRVRAGDGVSILEGRRLALHLMVQPEAAAGFLADPLLRDQGLLSRVLVVSPTSIAGTRAYKDVCPHDDAAIRAYGARTLSILEAPLPLADGKRNELQPRSLKFSPEAEVIWKTFFDHVEGQLGKGRELAPIGDLAAKIAEHAARIAGILAIVEDVRVTEIGASEMENAVTLADWYLEEALRLQQAARMDPKLIKAKLLLDWMHGTGKEIVTFSDILRLAPNAIRLKSSADEAVATLVAHGWVEETEKRPRKLRIVREG
ncbi:YfjI family protein [Aureimonas psammosilenae]|uniref:YfjI family protein n=1 Tax=Aureimonas psammosilenae TaxID=2495496 RepID=UPI001260F7CB|nr:YfjI family protein [Aureimonas psammosilenae]